METKELIEKAESVKDLRKDYKIIYELLDILGIKYRKTTCTKCRQDYLNIIKEELGMIDNAAEVSDFDKKYKYIRNRTFLWTRNDGIVIKINKNTPVPYIEEFIKEHKGFYIQTDKEKE